MRIIFGRDSYAIEKHARKIVNGIEKQDEMYPSRAIPKGVAFHLTKFPVVCEDCGNTFWAKDEWAKHLGCPGDPEKKETGFGF